MDIENLKVIMDTVSAVSGDAAAIAISYIVFDSILPFIGFMVFAFGSYKISRLLIEKIYSDNDEQFFIEMRGVLRTGISGHLTQEEKFATKKKLKELAYKSKE